MSTANSRLATAYVNRIRPNVAKEAADKDKKSGSGLVRGALTAGALGTGATAGTIHSGPKALEAAASLVSNPLQVPTGGGGSTGILQTLKAFITTKGQPRADAMLRTKGALQRPGVQKASPYLALAAAALAAGRVGYGLYHRGVDKGKASVEKQASVGSFLGGATGAGLGYAASEKPAEFLAAKIAPYLQGYLDKSQMRHQGYVGGQVGEQLMRNISRGKSGQDLDTRAILAVDKGRSFVEQDPQALIKTLLRLAGAVVAGTAGSHVGKHVENMVQDRPRYY